MVDEANTAFLMNMLLFEDRDVAAGHLARVRSIEEARELVQANRSALQFQNAYAAPSKCPFLPPPEQGGSAQAPSSGGACPWPFVWLHSPRAALVGHPCKNAAGTLALGGFAKFAWEFPRSAAAGTLACGLGCYLLKPKSSKRPDASRSSGSDAPRSGTARSSGRPVLAAKSPSEESSHKHSQEASGTRAPMEQPSCPWPFLWFHDPNSALVAHPVKNLGGVATLVVLGRVAWQYPGSSTASFVASLAALRRGS